MRNIRSTTSCGVGTYGTLGSTCACATPHISAAPSNAADNRTFQFMTYSRFAPRAPASSRRARNSGRLPLGQVRIIPASMLHAIIFVTGGAVLALELLASRIMTPYFGVSLYIWSGILSITLIALALGYWAGGWLSSRRPTGRPSHGKLV